jgi:hypothetical protein
MLTLGTADERRHGRAGLFTGRSRSFSGVSKAMASNTRQGTAESKVEDLRIAVAQLEQQLSKSQELDTNRFTEVVAVPKPADVQLLRLSIAWIVP